MAIFTYKWNLEDDGPGSPSPQQINLSLGGYKNIKGVRATMLGDRDTNPDQNVTYRLRYTEPDHYEHSVFVIRVLPGTEYKRTEIGSWNISAFQMCCFDEWVSVHTDCYWVSFKVEFSESGEFPPEELIPGHKFCMDGHLYEVGADGTSWFLVEANAAICQPIGECPDFWTDPVGAVVCWILAAFEAAIGLIEGGFYILQINMADFIENYCAEIMEFLDDPVTKIQEWTEGVFVLLDDFTDTIQTEITTWWEGVVGTIGGWWSDTWSDITAFWDGITTHIGNWWESTITSTGAWIAATWTNITTFWDDVTVHIESWWDGVSHDFGTWVSETWTGVTTFWADVETHFGTWWDSVRSDVGEWWNSATEDAVNGWNDFIIGVGDTWDGIVIGIITVIDSQIILIQIWLESWVPELIDTMFEWAKPLVSPIIAVANVLGKLLDITEESIERTPEEQVHIDDRAEINERIREIVEGR